MNFLGRLLLGTGELKPELKSALEAEGVVLIEEGLSGSVRYRHFKAPGRRAHGKITAERIGIGISLERVAIYCRSGSAKLIDTPFSNTRLGLVEVALSDEGRVEFRIDYDKAGEPAVAGQITISVKTPRAGEIAAQLGSRLGY